jgi:hypothetical protein
MFNSVKMLRTNIAEPPLEINTEQLCMKLVFVYYNRAFATVSVIQVNKEQVGNERIREAYNVTLACKRLKNRHETRPKFATNSWKQNR